MLMINFSGVHLEPHLHVMENQVRGIQAIVAGEHLQELPGLGVVGADRVPRENE